MNVRYLATLFLCTPLLAAEHGSAESLYDRHVIFDQCVAATSYFASEGSATAPSSLELVNGRLPLDSKHLFIPSQSLRISWQSSPGGDWQADIKSRSHYGVASNFDGDTLTLWCLSDTVMTPDEAPRIHLEDVNGTGTFTVSLLVGGDPLPAGKWVQLRIPLASFRAIYRSTDDNRFALSDLEKVVFEQGLDDGKKHTLYISDVQIGWDKQPTVPAPAVPTSLSVSAAERHFDIKWDADTTGSVLRYIIYRSLDGSPFAPIAIQQGNLGRYCDFVGKPPVKAAYKVSAVSLVGAESPPSAAAGGTTRAFSDDELLTMTQEGCFRYYWENGHPNAGMAIEVTPGDPNLVALGASGFGTMALIVGTDRGFVTREQGAARILKIVRFLNGADRFHGAWPHFLDGRTGKTIPFFGRYDDGGDLVETAFLMQGLLSARSYFDRDTPDEREIRDTITGLWRGVEWDWYRRQPDSNFLYWHWSPDHAWYIGHPLVGWNETMVVYLLAISSPTHSVPASMYYSGWAGQSDLAVRYRQGWSRTTTGDHYANGHEFYGTRLDVGEGTGGNLFFSQFSFLGFDPRGKRDTYTNYFRNNRALALINRAYCIQNPGHFVGYGPDCWGLSAGINSGGGMPQPNADNGTICCSAALGEFPFTPVESMAVLKHFYRDLGPKAWGIYGFHDGFNETEEWYQPIWMGLNQAQIVVMIENYRTGLGWKLFMSNPEIQTGLGAIGFKPDPEATH